MSNHSNSTQQAPSTEPKIIAADIAREFREDSKRWTQGHWARTESGERCTENHQKAACWCLRGAIDKRTPNDPLAVYVAFDAALGHTLKPGMRLEFVDWNDEPGRTVGEVIELCEKVANG